MTMVACVGADWTVLSPVLVFPAELKYIQLIWVADIDV